MKRNLSVSFKSFLFFTSAFLCLVLVARSQPANDDCGSVVPTVLTSGVPVTFNGDNTGATDAPGESDILGAIAVWEAVTVTDPCNSLVVDYCGTPPGNQSTVFIVYADCPTTTFFFPNDFNFSTCADGNATIYFNNLPPGTYYLPVLSDPGFNPLGAYTMNVVSYGSAPNDQCSNAAPIGCGVTSVSGYTFCSSADPEAFTCGTSVDGPGVWYTITGTGTAMSVTTCPNTFDTKLSLYTGTCGSFTCVTGNDDDCGVGSTINWSSTAGTTYYIFVHGFGGAIGNFTLTITPGDVQAPIPDAASLPDATGACSASVSTPTATDNCDGTVNGVITDTTYNSPGNITLTWTYTDGSGNSSTQPQNVITSDVLNPVITSCPPNITTTNTPGNCTATVSMGTPSATDNCGIAAIASSHPSSNYAIGTTNVTWTVYDLTGNTSTCVTQVTVNDGDAPNASCQNITVQLDSTGNVIVSAMQIDNGSIDGPVNFGTVNYDFETGTQGWTTGNEPLTFFGYSSISSTWDIQGFGDPGQSYGTPNVGDMGAENSWIMSPSLSLNGPVTLMFNSYSYNEDSPYDQENVEYSTDGGSTWNSAGTDPSFNAYGDGVWRTISFNLGTIVAPDVRFRFRFDTADDCCGPFGQTSWYIDNISITSVQQSCGTALTYTLSDSTFNCDDIGVNNVTLTVTDANGNSDNCSATITIEDVMNPVALVQDITVDVNGSGTVTIVPGDIDNGSYDNCGIVSYQLSDSTFYCGDSCSSTTALHFDGGDDYIEGTNANLPQAASARTIEAWINPELLAGQNGSIAEWGNTNYGERSGIMYVNQRLFYVGQGADVQGLIYIPQNQWTHVAATFDGTQVQLYVNGVADVSGTPFVNTTGNTFRIGTGGEIPPLTEYFKGAIDEVRIWNYARTQTEIQAYMNKCMNGLEPGMVGYYKFEEGSGTTANDNSSSAASGTLMNMAPSSWITATPNLNGGIPVALTVTDGSGNSDVGVAYVTVNDPVDPTFSTCPSTFNLCEGGVHTVIYPTPIATDNCSSVTVTQISGLPSGSLFTADTTINTFVAVDPSGNSDTCSFAVYIHPNPLVIWNLPPNNNVCLNGGTVTMNAIPGGGVYTGPGASGNTFDPMAAGLGNHYINYTYTDANGCASTVTQVYTVISCLGIEGEDDIVATIYPNPSNGVFTISLSNLPTGNNSLRLVNALGQVMYSGLLTSTNQTIDVSTIAAGSYYLQIFTDKGTISRQIVITQQY